MDNNFDNDDKEKMRKQILDELNNNSGINNPKINTNIQSYGVRKTSQVKFNGNEGYYKEEEEENKYENITNNTTEGNNKGLLVFLFLIILVGVLLFPKISETLSKYKTKKTVSNKKSNEQTEEVYEKYKLDDSVVVEARYPIMQYNNAAKGNYYTLDEMTVKNFSNNDILVSALADSYEGNMASFKGFYNGTSCASGAYKVSISARYLKLRIDNIFGTDTTYKITDFKIPTYNPKTKYTGIWKYNSKTDDYIYYGDCSKTKTNILYYDIKVPYDVDNSEKNTKMDIYNYVAFAQVNTSNNSYVLYKNADYTEQLTSGSLSTNSYVKELTDILSKLNKDNVNKYKFSFSTGKCSYQEYCFVGGQWVK